jgi:hypothetical protein
MDLLKNKLDDEQITYEVFDDPREIFVNINGYNFSTVYNDYFPRYEMKIFNYYPNFDSVEKVIDQIEDIRENETDYFDNLAYVDEDDIEDDESIIFKIIERLENKAELRRITSSDGKSKRKKSSKKSRKKSKKKSRKKSRKKSIKKLMKKSRKKSKKSSKR